MSTENKNPDILFSSSFRGKKRISKCQIYIQIYISQQNIAQSITFPLLACSCPMHPSAITSPGKWCTHTWPAGFWGLQLTVCGLEIQRLFCSFFSILATFKHKTHTHNFWNESLMRTQLWSQMEMNAAFPENDLLYGLFCLPLLHSLNE